MRKTQLLSLTILLLFNVFPVIAATADFDPSPEGGFTSREDWGVTVQLIFGSLGGERVFIPQQVRVLPRPELWVVMGGMGIYGERNVSLVTYRINQTTLKYDVLYRNISYPMKVGVGGNEFYAMRMITFPVEEDLALQCVFTFKDIEVEFKYEPNPLYIKVEDTLWFFWIMIIIWVAVTVVVCAFAELIGRKLQRHVAAIPGFPLVSVISISLSFILFGVLITYIAWGFTLWERFILFFTGMDPLVLQLPIFLCMMLWLGHRHSPETLRILQQDFSLFLVSEKSDKYIGEGYIKWKNVEWIKDMNTYLRAYEHNGEWFICDPDSWREFFWRIFGFRAKIIGHRSSMQPDGGVWHKNEERIYVGMTGFEIKGNLRFLKLLPSGITPNPNLNIRGFAQTIGIILIGGICFLGASLGVLEGLPNTLLAGLGIVITLVGLFMKGSIFEMELTNCEYHFDTIKHREAEVILRQQEEFFDIQHQMTEWEAKYANLKAHQFWYVSKNTRQYIEAVERILFYTEFIQEKGKKPTPEEIEAQRAKELGKPEEKTE